MLEVPAAPPEVPALKELTFYWGEIGNSEKQMHKLIEFVSPKCHRDSEGRKVG